jgi:CBS domain-containing protein
MRVRDLMEREVVTLAAGETLDLASDIMTLGRIRHMPVVSGETLVGVLSQRDLFRAAISSVLELGAAAERSYLATIRVRDAMSADVITIAPTASVREAVHIMVERRVGCLPVTEDDKLVGLLSESDCMRYLARVLDIAEEKTTLPELTRAG